MFILMMWFKRRFERRLGQQIEDYLEELGRSGRWPHLAQERREYLAILLNITDAESLSSIPKGDYRKFRLKLRELWDFDLYEKKGLAAVKCFISHYRARGIPALSPRELEAATR